MAYTCYNCFKQKPTGGVCPFCGYENTGAENEFPLALKPGSILNGRYTVGRVLGQGGFGITYIAQDYQTGERVAIKEYFPTEFTGREHGSSSILVHSGKQQENFDYGKAQFLEEAKTLPDKITRVLEDKERIQWFTAKFSNAHDIFFIGRGIDYAISLEGSLKMKEISYIHSEAYAAGELKHGTISLIEDGTLVIGVLTQSELYEKTVSNLVEVKSRGGYLAGVTSAGNYGVEDTVDFTIYIPKTAEIFAQSLAIIPLQLMGYYMSVAKGLDVDKPRNLAKSVTVE